MKFEKIIHLNKQNVQVYVWSNLLHGTHTAHKYRHKKLSIPLPCVKNKKHEQY